MTPSEDAEDVVDVADIYNRTTTRVELSDGSILGVEGVREGFAVTDYERALQESGSILILTPETPAPRKRAARQPKNDGGDGE